MNGFDTIRNGMIFTADRICLGEYCSFTPRGTDLIRWKALPATPFVKEHGSTKSFDSKHAATEFLMSLDPR